MHGDLTTTISPTIINRQHLTSNNTLNFNPLAIYVFNSSTMFSSEIIVGEIVVKSLYG